MADKSTQEEFKWFGEGFDGFPKRLPEDVVEYIVFIIDTQLSDTQTRERLQAFQRALTELEKKFLREYIWQREGIKLDLVREDGKWLLRGSTNYGDSVADEWLIVYFLRELSKQFSDAWIRVYDTDGEFLLIEAANALPKWLDPEIATNRVWINSHKLLIIPLEPTANRKSLSIHEALTILRKSPSTPKHYSEIESEAFHRLSSYPAAISENQHHATIPIPRKLALILRANPAYIAPAVEAFYLRDPISLRLIQPKHNPNGLQFPPTDWVTVSVRFTKILYAQLRSQEWAPPEPWGSSLEKLLDATNDSRSREKAEVGLKLAVGFEMLVQDKRYQDSKAVREIRLILGDLESGDVTLPSDEEVKSWGLREDDESWLDINFDDFEKELAGKGKAPPEGLDGRGFGDKAAQENLRKMVERFEGFLKDDDAGLEGAEGLEGMDIDNDDEETSDEDDDEEDISFDEAKFANLLRDIMGMPSAEKSAPTDEARNLAKISEEENEEADNEADEIQKLSEQMGAELKGYGALNLNPSPRHPLVMKDSSGVSKRGKGKAQAVELEDDMDDDESDLDIDFNLAQNLLQSLEGQAGAPGPAGNLMGLMGVRLPRDKPN